MPRHPLFQFPNLNPKIWILAIGRLLSEIGTGFILFYAPIFFVNVVGLSATAVGIALGSGSIAGVLGRFLGGSFVDSPWWGRRRTLLLSAVVSAVADLVLALTDDFPTLVAGNLLMGLGIGLYWPATEAAVADLTTLEQRNEAFAITRLADSLGLGIGVVLGGAFIAIGGNYRALFLVDSLSFILFFALIYGAIAETYQFHEQPPKPNQGWITALGDRRLMIYIIVNILFTTYLSQIQSTLPLYFKNFVALEGNTRGFSPTLISAIFTWHIVCAALFQLPVARFLNRFSYIQALIISLLLWGIGFILVWVTGTVPAHALVSAILALGVLAIAMVTYTPSASALVVELSPPSLRGVYFSINSQCWAIGYLIGPPLGGWALDQSPAIAARFWLGAAASIGFGIPILLYLDQMLPPRQRLKRLS
jgi:MFS family permease